MHVCTQCNQEFERKCDLSKHDKRVHQGLKNEKMSRKITCNVCQEIIAPNWLAKHLAKHQMSPKDIFIETNVFKDGVKDTLNPRLFLSMYYDNNPGAKSLDCRTIANFQGTIETIRPFKESDYQTFFGSYAEWKANDPSGGTAAKSYERCDAMFPNEPELAELLKQSFAKKNPYSNHGGKFSPFSKKFVNYENLSDEETQIAIKEFTTEALADRVLPQHLEYWLSRGYTEDEAHEQIKQRQSTNSIENIQARNNCTLEEATEIRQEITNKWQNTLNGKPLEERLRINRSKSSGGRAVSGAERKLLTELGLTEEHSQICIDHSRGWIYDICVNNKIIEYNGDYWHCNPEKYDSDYYNQSLHMTAEEKWTKDAEKINYAKERGYQVLVIWEKDYLDNPEAVISECVKFIENV